MQPASDDERNNARPPFCFAVHNSRADCTDCACATVPASSSTSDFQRCAKVGPSILSNHEVAVSLAPLRVKRAGRQAASKLAVRHQSPPPSPIPTPSPNCTFLSLFEFSGAYGKFLSKKNSFIFYGCKTGSNMF